MSPHHSDQMSQRSKLLGSRCSVVKSLIVSGNKQTKRARDKSQGYLLSCSGVHDLDSQYTKFLVSKLLFSISCLFRKKSKQLSNLNFDAALSDFSKHLNFKNIVGGVLYKQIKSVDSTIAYERRLYLRI